MIYIILPTFQRREMLMNTLMQLRRQTYQDFHILIIDSGEHLEWYTDFLHKLGTFMKRTTILKSDCYWAGSVNVGIDFIIQHREKYHYDNPVILIMNDDNIFSAEYLENSVSNLRIGSLVCSKTYSEGVIMIDWKRLKFNLHGLSRDVCCATRGLFIHFSDLLRIGKFSRLIPHYLSDYDWTIRAVKKGITLIEGERIETLEQERKAPTFSIKNPANPIFYTIFLIKHCPLYLIPLNILRVWAWAGINIFRKIKTNR